MDGAHYATCANTSNVTDVTTLKSSDGNPPLRNRSRSPDLLRLTGTEKRRLIAFLFPNCGLDAQTASNRNYEQWHPVWPLSGTIPRGLRQVRCLVRIAGMNLCICDARVCDVILGCFRGWHVLDLDGEAWQ